MTSSVVMVKDNFVRQLVQSKQIFQTIPEWAQFSQGHRRKRQKKKNMYITLTWKFQWKSCSISHLPFLSSNPKSLKAFLKTFAIKIKPPKCPPREKNNEARKKKKGGRIERKRKRKRKVKVKTAVSQNFALCACPNFEFASSHFASGSEGCEV